MEELLVRAGKDKRPTGCQEPAPPPLPELGSRSGPEGVWGDAEWGGKALALSRLRRHSLPVPAGFVLPVAVYRSAIRDPEVRQALQALGAALEGEPPPAPGALARDYPEIARAAAALRPRVEASWAAWRRGCPLRAASDERAEVARERPRWLVVRSSATGEDGEWHSFAGVLDSYLAVAPEHVPEAILLCWAAAYSRRFRGYCERNDIDAQEVGVGVVVQEMVAARAAGVLYTQDPVSGASGPVINAIRGLGSALVQGEIAPDEYRRRGRGARRAESGRWEEQGGRQSWQEILTDAGLVRGELAPEARVQPVLTRRERDALARLGQRVARLMAAPQDIEWAIQDEQIWLLKARPITTLPARARVWTRANLKEIYPELPSPMTASLLQRYDRNWLVELFAARGFRVRHLAPAVRFLRGRPYLNQALLEQLAAAAGLSTAAVGQGVGSAQNEEPAPGGIAPLPSPAPNWRAVLQNALPLARLLLGYLFVFPRACQAIAVAAQQAQRLTRASLDRRSDAELLAGAVAAFRSLRPLDIMVADVAGAIEVWSMLAAVLLKGAVASPARFLAATIRRIDENVTARQVRDFEALIGLARTEDRVRQWLAESEAGGPADWHALRDTRFGAALSRFLATYGCRAIHESDSAVPRFAEDPRPLLQALRAAVLAPPAASRGEREAQRQREEAGAWSELRRGLAGWERLVPVRAGSVRLLVGSLQRLYALREEVRLAGARVVAGQRRWELALGARWAERDWLSAPEDYFWLRFEDVERAVAEAGALPPGWPREQVERHRAEHQAWAATPMPNEWIDGAAPGSESPRPAEPWAAPSLPQPEDARREDAAGELRGLPVSPGLVEGEVTVLTGPEELDAVQPGSILVLPVIGPSWLPLFTAARGLVVEMGGVLSHGAILAREYGLPAVANLPGVTQRLRTGERIRLDGTRGIVSRLGAPEAAGRGAPASSKGVGGGA